MVKTKIVNAEGFMMEDWLGTIIIFLKYLKNSETGGLIVVYGVYLECGVEPSLLFGLLTFCKRFYFEIIIVY